MTLADVKPRNDRWSPESTEFARARLHQNFARIFTFESNPTGSYTVALYIDGDINFASLLASNGFADTTGPR